MSSELPDVLKVTPLKRPVDQECSTDILQPTTISQSYCRFVLPNVGILISPCKSTVNPSK